MKSWHYLTGAAVLVVGLSLGLFLYLTQNFGGPQVANGQDPTHGESPVATASSGGTSVDVMHPAKGMDLEVEQPGSVHAFESVNLRPKVSGFLKKLNVDIGDRVKRGQVLATIDVPELEKQLLHNKASLKRP